VQAVNKRATIIAGAALLMLGPVLVPAAHADTGPNPVSCTDASSCVIALEGTVTFNGNWSDGTNNTDVTVSPPPCEWDALGDASESETIVQDFARYVEIDGDLNAEQQAELAEAEKIAAEQPPPAGEWYGIIATGDTQGEIAECPQSGDLVWVPAGPGGTVGPPPIQLPARTLAQLALAVMNVPTPGNMVTSPSGGTTYSNLPTFVQVTLNGYESGTGGQPYVVVSAALDGVGATVWAKAASDLLLTSSAEDASFWTKSCGYLGSTEMTSDPAAVAGAGVNTTGDCGLTFHVPQTATITASYSSWQTCWIARALPVTTTNFPLPPANCRGVPGTPNLPGPTWNQTLNVEEIQAGNG
jgi:hypothetical protein